MNEINKAMEALKRARSHYAEGHSAVDMALCVDEAVAALSVHSAADAGEDRYNIDADPKGIRALVSDAITGAIALGAQDEAPAPDGHWLAQFWTIGRTADQWRSTVWAIARALNCLPSTYADANGHVLRQAEKLMVDLKAAASEPAAGQCGESCERAKLCGACARGLEEAREPVALKDWEDPRVQKVYEILCDTETEPPEGHHWEGFQAQRIVAALAAYAHAPVDAPAVPAGLVGGVMKFLEQLDGAHYSLSADAHLALADLRREAYAAAPAPSNQNGGE